MYSTPRKSPRRTSVAEASVLARALAYKGITTTARNPCATMLAAAARFISACARSSVITGDCCFIAN